MELEERGQKWVCSECYTQYEFILEEDECDNCGKSDCFEYEVFCEACKVWTSYDEGKCDDCGQSL